MLRLSPLVGSWLLLRLLAPLLLLLLAPWLLLLSCCTYSQLLAPLRLWTCSAPLLMESPLLLLARWSPLLLLLLLARWSPLLLLLAGWSPLLLLLTRSAPQLLLV